MPRVPSSVPITNRVAGSVSALGRPRPKNSTFIRPEALRKRLPPSELRQTSSPSRSHRSPARSGSTTSVRGERLAHRSVLNAFLGILGALCALLTGWFASLDIAKRKYMRAMRSLGLLALATALAFNGFALMV